jgi:signal transduction histidine kinase
MTARMRQLGGSLHMRSRASGTTVHAIVPLAATEHDLLEPQIAAE